jgi:hypothetical protein
MLPAYQMTSDPTSLLDPTAGLMIWMAIAVATAAVLGTGIVLAVSVRAMRRMGDRAISASSSPAGTGALQTQVDALQSQVHELGEANRFLEQLVTERRQQPSASPSIDSER